MLKYGDGEVTRKVALDHLAFDEDYPFWTSKTINGITIDFHSDCDPNKPLPKSFSIYGFDPNVQIYDKHGFGQWAAVFDLPLTRQTVNGVKVYHPDYTRVDSHYQGNNIMHHVYKHAMATWNFCLVSGNSQSPGSVKCWNRLARLRGVKIYSYRPRHGWSRCKSGPGELVAEHWKPYDHERAVCVARVS